ncbi:hypothetical protein D3C80_1743030 [compost metagenome]
MRVIAAHDLADDLGAFARRRLRVQPHLVHGVHDAPVHRLEAVAHVGQRAVGDRGQGVGEIALRQRIAHRLFNDAAAFGRRSVDGHVTSNRRSDARSLAH